MSQFDFSWWNFGGTTTSTTVLVLKPGPGVLHAINVNSSAVGDVAFYNATSSSAATLIASINPGIPTTHIYDLIFNATLCRGQTTSTADLTVSFW